MHYLPTYEDIQSHQVLWRSPPVGRLLSLFLSSADRLSFNRSVINTKSLLSKMTFKSASNCYRLIAHDSMSSAMLSAVRKSPTAISTQVMSSYCPIYPLTPTKGYWGEKDRRAVKDNESETQAVLKKVKTILPLAGNGITKYKKFLSWYTECSDYFAWPGFA